MTDQRRAMILGLTTVLLWSTVASAFKLSLRYLPIPLLLLYASLVSTVVLASILVAQGRLGQALRSTRRQCLAAVVRGLLNPFAYYLVLLGAYSRLPAQEAQPLNYTWALTLAYLSIPLLRQRPNWHALAAGPVCYLGVLVIATRGDPLSLHFSDSLGVALALGSTVIWALYWILNARSDQDPVVGLFLGFLFALPPVALYAAMTTGVAVPGWRALGGAVYIGLFEMGISFVTWIHALRLAENAAQVSNLIFLSPFVSLIFIHFIVGEVVLKSTAVGLVLIVLGLLIQQRGMGAGSREAA